MKNRQNNKKTKQLSVHKLNRGEVFISLIHDYSATHTLLCVNRLHISLYFYMLRLYMLQDEVKTENMILEYLRKTPDVSVTFTDPQYL